MKTSALLAAASVLALCAGGASAAGLHAAPVSGKWNSIQVPKGAKSLYNQNSNDAGYGITDQGADDFVVPKGQVWTVTEVDVSGVYYNGSGPAKSEDVVFYKNTGSGEPGKRVKKGTFKDLDGTGSPDFAIKLPSNGLELKAGHYWVSVVANCLITNGCGQYGWDVTSDIHNDPAVQVEDGGGWQPIDGDLMFDLRGTSKRK